MPGAESTEGLHIALAIGGRQPAYAAQDGRQTRAATTIEGENSLNENTVSTVDFFLFSPKVESGAVVLDADGDTVWVRTYYGRHTVASQTMTDEDANDHSPDADGNAVTPDYYPTEYFTVATGSSTSWIESLGLVPGSRLYALANVDWANAKLPVESEGADGIEITYTAASASDITSVGKLKALSLLDADIYKKEKAGESAGAQEMTGKRFLMDGLYRFTQADIDAYKAAPNAVHQETVSLRRAAAKVRVNIFKATSWTDENGASVTIQPATIQAKVNNYATRTKAFAPEAGEGLGENGHASTYAELNTYVNDGVTAPSGTAYLTSVLFYTFAHDWSNDIGHETTFIMNLPYEGRTNNWYKIVFVPDGNPCYHRNTFYEVNVTVAYDGSMESYEPAPISNPQYKVSEWYPEEFDVENATPVDYLILDKYFIDMRNVAETQITFYSSNKVTVEVVHDVEAEIAALGGVEAFPWPEGFESRDEYIGEDYDSRELTQLGISVATIPGIYYPDKENHRVPIYHDEEKGVDKNTTNSTADTYYGLTAYNDDGTGTYDSESSAGNKNFADLNNARYLPVTVKPYAGRDSQYEAEKEQSEVYITWPGDEFGQDGRLIDLYSAIPRNATLRFITLKVRMKKLYIDSHTAEEDQYITRYVIIKQYPLVYVVNQFGLYSLMDGSVLKRTDLNNQDHYVIDFADQAYHQGKKSDDLYQLYCHDMEAWKDASYWVTVPNEIVYGTYEGSAVKVYGTTSETTFKHVTETETTDDNGSTVVTRTQTTKPYSLTGNVSYNPNMKCKFYLDGTTKTFTDDANDYAWNQHRYNDVGTIHYGQIYQINSAYNDGSGNSQKNDDNLVGLDNNASAYNNRMYEVRVTATSSKYRIGYPKMLNWTDENGNSQIYADPSEQNNQLVSPHFVFASQLGNASATPYWEMAQDHCMHYVEVDNKGNVYKDWRLPTIAELSTIKQFQQDENIFNVTMSRILNSDGETNPCYWTAGQSSDGLGWYVDTQGAGLPTKITSSGKTQEVGYGIYGPWLYNSDGTYQTDTNGDKVANGKHKTAAIESSKAIRIRCVRDIKGE